MAPSTGKILNCEKRITLWYAFNGNKVIYSDILFMKTFH